MLKLIVDTNVFVSSLVQQNYPFLVVDAVFRDRKRLQLCISDELLNEYHSVLSRIKFFKYPDYEIKIKKIIFRY